VGRPVVTTDAGGVAEMVTHMQNGMLVPNGNEEKLRDAVLLLLSKPDLMKRLSRNAVKTIEERFSEERMLDQLETFFMDTIRWYASQSLQCQRGDCER
jgi:glycosyltransferase involved in cell wall biosynthesis